MCSAPLRGRCHAVWLFGLAAVEHALGWHPTRRVSRREGEALHHLALEWRHLTPHGISFSFKGCQRSALLESRRGG